MFLGVCQPKEASLGSDFLYYSWKEGQFLLIPPLSLTSVFDPYNFFAAPLVLIGFVGS